MEPDVEKNGGVGAGSGASDDGVYVPKATLSVPSPLRKEQGRADLNTGQASPPHTEPQGEQGRANLNAEADTLGSVPSPLNEEPQGEQGGANLNAEAGEPGSSADTNKADDPNHKRLDNMIKMAEEINGMMADNDKTKGGNGANSKSTLDSIKKDLEASVTALKKEHSASALRPRPKPTPKTALTNKERKIVLLFFRMLFTLQFASMLYFFLFIQVERTLAPSDFPKRALVLVIFSFMFPPIIPDLVLLCLEPSNEIWEKPIEDIWVQCGLETKKSK